MPILTVTEAAKATQRSRATLYRHIKKGELSARQQPDGSKIGAGTARYIRSEDNPEEAEFAVTIADDCQRLGLATMLMDVLTRHAKHNGIRRFTAVMLAENLPIHELIRHRGGVIEQTDEPTIVSGYIDIC